MISPELRGSLLALLSGLFYGFLAYFGLHVINASITPTTMLFWRFLIASIAIFCVLIIRCRGNPFKSSLKNTLVAFLNGFIFYGSSTIFYFYAIPYIGSGLAMVIFFSFPAFVMLLNNLVHGQAISKWYCIAMLIIIMGMSFFLDEKTLHLNILGIVFALMAALGYAAYIFSSQYRGSIAPDLYSLLVSLGCMTTCAIASLMNHSFVIPHAWTTWMNLLGIGVLSTAIPILLLLASLNTISSEKASILSVFEPVSVVIIGMVLLNEYMEIRQLIGVLVVLSGSLITLLIKKNPTENAMSCSD